MLPYLFTYNVVCHPFPIIALLPMLSTLIKKHMVCWVQHFLKCHPSFCKLLIFSSHQKRENLAVFIRLIILNIILLFLKESGAYPMLIQTLWLSLAIFNINTYMIPVKITQNLMNIGTKNLICFISKTGTLSKCHNINNIKFHKLFRLCVSRIL